LIPSSSFSFAKGTSTRLLAESRSEAAVRSSLGASRAVDRRELGGQRSGSRADYHRPGDRCMAVVRIVIAACELLMRQVRRAPDASTRRPRSSPARAGAARPGSGGWCLRREARCRRPRHGHTGRDTHVMAWQWALANRSGDGSPPSGRDIGRQHDRHERWGGRSSTPDWLGSWTARPSTGSNGSAWVGTPGLKVRGQSTPVRRTGVHSSTSRPQSVAQCPACRILPIGAAEACHGSPYATRDRASAARMRRRSIP
jgi:hypothetical protein